MTWRRARSASLTRSRWPGCSASRSAGVQTECRGDQRGEGLDVRTHHDDVPRLQGGIVGQHADQHLTEHLDLTVRTVTGVQLHTAVAGIEHRARGSRPGLGVGGDVRLQPRQQRGRWRFGGGRVVDVVDRDVHRAQPQLQLADVPPEVGEQPVVHAILALVVRPRCRAVEGFDRSQLIPEGGGRMGQPEMNVPVLRQCGEHQPVVVLEPGDAEDREPFGQTRPAGIGVQSLRRGRDQFGRMRPAHLGRESAPQLGLPGPVRRECTPGIVDIAALRPGGDHGGPAHRVRGEELGQVPSGRPTSPAADRIGVLARPPVAEIVPQQRRPGFTAAAVDHPQQRPDGALRLPRVKLGVPAQGLADGARGQSPR